MADFHDPGQAAEFSRQFEDMWRDAQRIAREVQPFVESLRAAREHAELVGDRVRAFHADWALVVEQLEASMRAYDAAAATFVAPPVMVAGAGGVMSAGLMVTGEGQVINPGARVTVTESEVVQAENISRLLTKASRDGVESLNCGQVLTLALVWVLLLGLLIYQATLPPEAQTVLTGELATIGIAITLTQLILRNRGR